MRYISSVKRLAVLLLRITGILLETAVYAYMWFHYYYPRINNNNLGLKFYSNGHLLILGIFFALLWFFTSTYGGMKIGYLKPIDVIISQIVAALIVDIITYVQLSLMNNWLLDAVNFLFQFLAQIAIIILWSLVCNWIVHRVYPPREMLLIHGDRPYEDIVMKFNSRKDRFIVKETIHIGEGMEAIEQRIKENFRTVLLWDIPTCERNKLLKFCYSESIHVYMMPKIPDVIIKGAHTIHLFDTPLFLTGEMALTVEQRLVKRLIDVVLSLILIIVLSPLMLVTAIAIKLYDRGPVLYKQIRCTDMSREFKILKFRSMRVDAEKDGVARLSSKKDNRVTPIGRFIRSVRIDELPQLFNIFVGDMSFIGPRPERPEIIAQYVKEMPEFVFRMKMKAGLAGYAQVYGKYNTTPYDKLKLDLTYIENYSIWLDLKLMLLTLKILVKPESTEGVEGNQTTAMKVIDTEEIKKHYEEE